MSTRSQHQTANHAGDRIGANSMRLSDVFSACISLLAVALLLLTLAGIVNPLNASIGTLSLALVSAINSFKNNGRDIFHPAVFPGLYTTYALLLPIIYTALSEKQVRNLDYASLNPLTVVLMSGFCLAFIAIASIPNTKPRPRKNSSNRYIDARKAELLGNLFLLGAVVAKIIQAIASRSLQYGEGQIEYGLRAAATTAAEGLLLIAALTIVVSRSQQNRPVLGKLQGTVVIGLVVFSFIYLGSRSEVIAPALVVLWAATRTRPIRSTTAILLGAFSIATFNWVGNLRSENDEVTQIGNVFERSFVDTSTPIIITDTLVSLRLNGVPELLGSTYVSAMQMLAPGFISRTLVDGPPATATYIYRELTGLNNPNAGVGFSMPSEAYLNFGTVGVIVAAALYSVLFVALYRFQNSTSDAFMGSAYIIVASSLPYAIRSDALTQMKLIVYPLIAMALVSLLASARTQTVQNGIQHRKESRC